MRNRLMTRCPVEIEADILTAGSRPQIYDNNDVFTMMMSNLYGKLRNVFDTEDPVYITPVSEDCLTDMIMTNFTDDDSKILILDRNDTITPFRRLAEKWGNKAFFLIDGDMDAIENVLTQQEIKLVIARYDDSTANIAAISRLCHDYDAMIAIDVTTSISTTSTSKESFEVDIMYAAGSSALALPYGISLISLNTKAIKALNMTEKADIYNLRHYIKAYRENKLAYSISMPLLTMLDKRMDRIQLSGITNMCDSFGEHTVKLRTGLSNLGFTVYGDNILNCITYASVPASSVKNIDEIIQYMGDKHSWQLNKVQYGDKNAGTDEEVLEICNFGNIAMHDIDSFIESLSKVITGQDDKDEKELLEANKAKEATKELETTK